MAMIEFSLIPDAETDFQTMVDVHIKRMERGNAWSQRIGIATQGYDVDTSHAGSTWVSSLMTMNARHPSPST